MATRVVKLREQGEPRQETETDLPPQRKRPEVGRYLLQVDRQTKGSYGTAQAAEAAGIYYVDLFYERANDPFTRDPERYFAGDRMHPNAEGVKRIVARLLPSVEALLGKVQQR